MGAAAVVVGWVAVGWGAGVGGWGAGVAGWGGEAWGWATVGSGMVVRGWVAVVRGWVEGGLVAGAEVMAGGLEGSAPQRVAEEMTRALMVGAGPHR